MNTDDPNTADLREAPPSTEATAPSAPVSEPVLTDAEKTLAFFDELAASLSEADMEGLPDDLSERVDEICYGPPT